MTETERYSGYKWIRVPRSVPVELDGQRYVSEQHHIEETVFLIEEVRKLARQIDELRGEK